MGMALQVAEALQALHSSDPQIIHRDLKTENLMLTKSGRSGDIRVMDFGLAKLRSAPLTPVHPAMLASSGLARF